LLHGAELVFPPDDKVMYLSVRRLKLEPYSPIFLLARGAPAFHGDVGAHQEKNMVKHEALKNHLETLRNSIPELRGVLLASTEGLPVAHSLSNGTDPNRVAAMAAAATSLGRRISESMATGGLSEVSIRGDDGVLFVYSAGPKAVLAVIGPMGSNAGLIHLEARGIAKEIGELF